MGESASQILDFREGINERVRLRSSPRKSRFKNGTWSAFIRLFEIYVRSEAVQLLAGSLDHLQEIRCVCRFWSMASPKAGGKGAGCQDSAGEMLAQLFTEPVSQSDLGMWQSFHHCRHFPKVRFLIGNRSEDPRCSQEGPEGEVRSALFGKRPPGGRWSNGPVDSKAFHAAFL